MKAKWREVGADRLHTVKKFSGGVNLSSRELPNVPMVTRRGRRNMNLKPNTDIDIRAKRLFTLANGHLAVAANIYEANQIYRIYNLDSMGWLGKDIIVDGALTYTELLPDRGDVTTLNINEDKVNRVKVLASTEGMENIVRYDRSLTQVPTFFPKNFVVMHNGRLTGANENSSRVAFYELGQYSWDFLKPGKLDILEVGGDNPNCTGLTSYKGSLIYFSANSMYEILGNEASKRRVNVICDDVGCVSAYSIASVNGSLIWLGREGIYEWNGGVRPKLISGYLWSEVGGDVAKHLEHLDISDLYTMPQAIPFGESYYISIVPNDETREADEAVLLVYDTVNRVWHVEKYGVDLQSAGAPVSFAKRDGVLYAIDRKGNLWSMADRESTEVPEWSWDLELEQGTRRVKIDLEADNEEDVSGEALVDGEVFEVKRAGQQWLLPLDKTFHKRAKFRLKGKGEVKIRSCEISVSDRGWRGYV